MSFFANTGEPSASMTTTPSWGNHKPGIRNKVLIGATDPSLGDPEQNKYEVPPELAVPKPRLLTD
jgi:hypothetical protein